VTDAFAVPKWLKIDLSGIIQIVLILGMIWAGWTKFDARLGQLEQKEEADREATLKESMVLDQLSQTLDKLNITLETFPLHLHLNGGQILYPGGRESHAPSDHGNGQGH